MGLTVFVPMYIKERRVLHFMDDFVRISGGFLYIDKTLSHKNKIKPTFCTARARNCSINTQFYVKIL